MRIRDLKPNAQSFWRLLSLLLALALAAVGRVQSQGTFQNLNFESVNLATVPSGQFGSMVPIGLAFPGWSGTDGFVPFTQVYQNNGTAGTVSIDILGPDWNGGFPGTIIQGNYTAVLQAGDATQGHVPAILQQTGQIAVAMKSILFKASGNVSGSLTMSFAGQNLSYVPLSAGPNYELYGGDISPLAGQTGALAFAENPNPSVPGGLFSTVLLDDIVFSPNAIPEPGTWVLLLCGAGVFGWRRYASSRFKV